MLVKSVVATAFASTTTTSATFRPSVTANQSAVAANAATVMKLSTKAPFAISAVIATTAVAVAVKSTFLTKNFNIFNISISHKLNHLFYYLYFNNNFKS